MPFTLAHPAAVLPFAKTRLPLSALVIGSVVPDFEYMMRLEMRSEISHTITGIFTFCVPFGFLALLLFHHLLKKPLIGLMPGTVQARLSAIGTPFAFAPVRRFFTILFCLALGAATHLAWDSFTHSDGAAVVRIHALSKSVLPAPHILPLYKILQHGSTLFGLSAIGIAIARWFHASAPIVGTNFQATTWRKFRLSIALLFGAVISGVLIAMFKCGIPHDFESFRCVAVLGVVSSELAMIVLLTIYALSLRLIHAARR